MKNLIKSLLQLFITVVILTVVVCSIFLDGQGDEFLTSGRITIILLGAIMILIIGSIYTIKSFKEYNPEMHMQKLMSRTNLFSIEYVCYRMMQRENNRLQAAATIFPLFGIIWVPYDRAFPGLAIIALIVVVLNILVIKRYGSAEFRILANEAFLHIPLPVGDLRDELNSNIKKGVHFKSKHLLITEDYIIGYRQAVAKDTIESFCLQECKPEVSYGTLKGNREMCTMELLCQTTNGQEVSFRLGSDYLEIAHIIQFLDYYAGVESRLLHKYKGIQK